MRFLKTIWSKCGNPLRATSRSLSAPTSQTLTSNPLQRSEFNSPSPKPAAIASVRVKAPLRVVHVVDKELGRGRLVISGRMSDVCEELERLAAREAALSM